MYIIAKVIIMTTTSKTKFKKTPRHGSNLTVVSKGALYTKPMQLRLAPEGYTLIQQAATLRGMSASEYARDVLEESAKRTLSEHFILQLAGENARRFADAVLQPKASKTLKTSFRDFPPFTVKAK
jgi:uncharacterized protein (DUF1778 family)